MPPPARLLDLTRLVSRAERTLTGVDRVELAYAERLAADPVPPWGLVRTALGYLLLDRAGVAAVGGAAREGGWGAADRLSRLARLPDARGRGQSFARARARGRATPWGLGRLLARLPQGTTTFNVGHSDLTERTLRAAKALGPLVVMIHDAIPLDLPHLQRPGTAEGFRAKLARVGRLADLVLCPSEAAAADVRRHLLALGRVPPIRVAPLGIAPANPDPAALPPMIRGGLPPTYFVVLGTIEPRKNHALLLDLWAAWPEAPPLFVVGARGWADPGVLARLDARPRGVVELGGLSDGAVAALLSGATALLMPSRAEGYGLPALEALSLGTAVVCSDLPVFRETLGHRAIFCDPRDPAAWAGALRVLAQAARQAPEPFAPPTWDAHFKAALTTV